MSDRRWLAALAAIAATLALVLVLDPCGQAPAPATDRLVPELAAGPPERVALERPGEPTVELEAGSDGWSIVAPLAAPADPAAVRGMLGALELLAPQRRRPGQGRDEALGLASPRAIVRLAWPGGGARVLAIGSPAAGGGSTWLGIEGDAFAIPAHAAREIAPTLGSLRRRAVAAPAGAPQAIELAREGRRGRLELAPTARVALEGGTARADPAAAAAIAGALRRLELSFGRRVAGDAGAARLHIEGSAGAAELEVTGRCEGGALAVRTSIGDGCVPEGALDPFGAVAADPGALVDRRPLPAAEWTSIELSRGGAREVVAIGASRRAAAAAWTEALADAVSGELVAVPEGPPIASAVARAGETAHVLHLLDAGDRVALRRDDEPIALAASRELVQLLDPDAGHFEERVPLPVDPTQIRALTWRRGERELARWTRGAILEAWSDRSGASVAGRAGRAIEALTSPAGLGGRAADQPEATLVALVAPLAGEAAPEEVAFELAAGCRLRRQGARRWLVLEDAACAALTPGAR